MAAVGRGVGEKRGVGVRVGLGVGVMVFVGVMDGAAVWAGATWVPVAVGVWVSEAAGVRVEVDEGLAVDEGDDVADGASVPLPELEVSATGTVGSASTLGEGLAVPTDSTAATSVVGGVPQAASMLRITTTAKIPDEARQSGLCAAEPEGRYLIPASMVLSLLPSCVELCCVSARIPKRLWRRSLDLSRLCLRFAEPGWPRWLVSWLPLPGRQILFSDAEAAKDRLQ
jgi:hypothetical protein